MIALNRQLVSIFASLAIASATAAAQALASDQLRDLNDRVHRLESRSVQTDAGDGGIAAFLAGTFCALWAQNTRRDPWLWFFLGLFFNVITLLVLLSKNARDRRLTPQT
ncbi:MAG TPA: hypothetical protein VL992_15410 [Tepidisphaeraceae bacterium]|nr:hypothetical protein [Tepidisphaeraceae bacterium]